MISFVTRTITDRRGLLSPITIIYHYSLTDYFKHPTDTMKTLACTARHLPPIERNVSGLRNQGRYLSARQQSSIYSGITPDIT